MRAWYSEDDFDTVPGKTFHDELAAGHLLKIGEFFADDLLF
jgi:hypothetical protein